MNTYSIIYGFTTNITCLKGVNKQDWNSSMLMIQKPYILLAVKNTGRWVVCLIVQETKTMVQKEMPFPELACSSNNSKAMARGKSPTKSAKDLRRHSNPAVSLMNGPMNGCSSKL